jgi:ABC-type multidrug transport system ATPase subunit
MTIFQIDETIKDVGLEDQRNTFAKDLSGGQMRKLSVAIAIIGDPKV